ncbi:MAG TPA: hypothetical protein VM531_11105 [Sphingomicrobium sp.]|jgi:hypothetical protein|nr:hypothetical protein [Sphingomicrobium sp.]
MAYSVAASGIIKHLIEEELIPKESLNVQINFPTDGVLTVRYEVFMTGDRLARFQRAFAKFLAENPESDLVVI